MKRLLPLAIGLAGLVSTEAGAQQLSGPESVRASYENCLKRLFLAEDNGLLARPEIDPQQPVLHVTRQFLGISESAQIDLAQAGACVLGQGDALAAGPLSIAIEGLEVARYNRGELIKIQQN